MEAEHRVTVNGRWYTIWCRSEEEFARKRALLERLPDPRQDTAYVQAVAKQGQESCAICGSSGPLTVDLGADGKARGLLCAACERRVADEEQTGIASAVAAYAEQAAVAAPLPKER